MPFFLRRLLLTRPFDKINTFYHVKRFARTLTGDKNFVPLTEDTLTGRFLIYLNNGKEPALQNNHQQLQESVLDLLKKSELCSIAHCDINEISFALKSLNNPKHIHSRYEFIKFLNILDNECCQRIHALSATDTFRLLCAYMDLIPNRIVDYKFYNLAITKLFSMSDFMSKNELVELIFYIGLQKKSIIARDMLTKCLKKFSDSIINNLTKEELCIICNSTFKTSTKIRNKMFLDKIVTYLSDNLCLLKDPAIFITFIKTIRHNRAQTEDLLETISCTMFFNKTFECYSFTAICHILALYSDFLYYDENVLNLFKNKCIQQLKESRKHVPKIEQIRCKDINRFLWALSNLNYSLDESDIKNVLIPKILAKIEAGEFKTDPGMLIEIVLYLWMMNYKAYELVPYALTKEIVEAVRGEKSLRKQRLNLLLNCIRIEDSNLYQKLNFRPEKPPPYNSSFQLQKRPILQKTLEFLKSNSGRNGINKFEMQCQVPFINIIGITGYRNIYKTINIEMLDEYTCLKNTENLPSGPMQLKLRLLDQTDEGLIVIEEDELKELSDKEIQEILGDDISFVC